MLSTLLFLWSMHAWSFKTLHTWILSYYSWPLTKIKCTSIGYLSYRNLDVNKIKEIFCKEKRFKKNDTILRCEKTVKCKFHKLRWDIFLSICKVCILMCKFTDKYTKGLQIKVKISM